jgi:hypothetical protein
MKWMHDSRRKGAYVLTYLKRFYFDDRKLKQRALLELIRAFESGRMIAFVGSMATEALGYHDWSGLIRDYVATADRIARKHPVARDAGGTWAAAEAAIAHVKKFVDDERVIDKRVALSSVREALGAMDLADPLPGLSRTARLDEAAKKFGARKSLPWATVEASVVHSLRRYLAIRRYATLNYDLELEAALMVEPQDGLARFAALEQIEQLIAQGRIRADEKEVRHRLTRLLSHGLSVESDVRDRERPDRMIEFAVGSADVDYRIMHLHGRATVPETMIIGLRDYDRLYRKDDLAKLPFEHGQRILFAGNPVLFVGVGMTEPEVNATLQDFVSNNPYRRFAPAFLLWNTGRLSPDDNERERQIALKRIDFLQRLGVFAIFDTDLLPDEDANRRLHSLRRRHRAAATAKESRKRAARKQMRSDELDLLRDSVALLARAGGVIADELGFRSRHWRSVAPRMAKLGEENPVALWGTSCAPCAYVPKTKHIDKIVRRRESAEQGSRAQACLHSVIIAPPGAGKGSFAWWLAHQDRLPAPFNVRKADRLIINAGFAFDTDFLLHSISKYLLKLKGYDDLESGPPFSREKQFEQPGAFKLTTPGLIIINGIERFFTVAGAPLSAELDHLLRQVVRLSAADSDVRWVFLGSERIERYFMAISPNSVVDFDQICAGGWLEGTGEVNSVYLSGLLEKYRRFAKKRRPSLDAIIDPGPAMYLKTQARGAPHALGRAVLGPLLTPNVLDRIGTSDTGLALEVLRAMAFIGSPVEDVVLLHVPRIRQHIKNGSGQVDASRLVRTIDELEELGLVTAVSPFEGNPKFCGMLWRRIGLHHAVSWELRHQFGIPVSESKLSTSFNMSLFVAQPVDGFVPEVATHEELADLVDYLIGAYKDELRESERADITPSPRVSRALAACCPAFIPAPLEALSEDKLRALCSPAATSCLRAALSVVRGYYSTTSLLTLDRDDGRVSEDRDGVLVAHAERLERLVRAYRKLTRFRAAAFDAMAATMPETEVRDKLGPEPFYPDDLVWIFNELGSVYLAQGDLYSARRAFGDAMQVNVQAVEYKCRSHNWRRISINQVLLDIERAGLTAAERKLQQIEDSIDRRPAIVDPAHVTRHRSRFSFIRNHFGEGAPAERTCFDREVMHEELLMTALVLGHRGLCQHIRGHLRSAEPLYQDAIAILRRLGEHRAYAFFQRHFALLHRLLHPERGGGAETRLAVTAAESVRQMDMAYHARIIDANAAWKRSGADALDRRHALRQLADAASYGALMDLHRLRIEAGIALARLKFESGDYETALDHATEAMALASRYGHSLRKISIRLDMGQILIRRGDPKSGAALLAHAAEAADRFGYQRAVETAQRIRVEEGITA